MTNYLVPQAQIDLEPITNAISAVCPIEGVAANGRIDFAKEATQEQRTAAQQIMDTWDWNAPPPVKLYPYELQQLLRPEQKIALMLSTEAPVVLLRLDLTTIVSPMPMTTAQMATAMQILVGYRIVTVEEAAKLTRGESLN